MNKATIQQIARRNRPKAQAASALAKEIASEASQRPQDRETSNGLNLTPETIEAIVDGFSRELRRALLEVGPFLARLAAADTIHSVEHKATIMSRSLVEGQTAAALLAKLGIKA